MTTLLLANGLVVVGLMVGFWAASVPLRNVGIVDIAWGLGFALIAWTTLAVRNFAGSEGDSVSKFLLPVATTIWGLRLSAHIGWRNHGRPEDKRYAAMRSRREPGFWWKSLGIVFLLQAGIMAFVAMPLLFAAGRIVVHPVLAGLGVALWLVGMVFEAGGDWQLARFRANASNRQRVLDSGFWRYTRHPNYFGDFCVWWGLFCVAVAAGAPWWTGAGPAMMTFFLMRVSGVPLLESSLRAEKPEYAAYVRRTSAFFPWKPRSEA